MLAWRKPPSLPLHVKCASLSLIALVIKVLIKNYAEADELKLEQLE